MLPAPTQKVSFAVDTPRAAIESVTSISLAQLPAALRRAREQRRVTLTELSHLTGTSISTLSRLESGQRRPTVELVLRISLALGVPPESLIAAPGGALHGATAPLGSAPHDSSTPLTHRRSGFRAFRLTLIGEPALPSVRTHAGHEWIYVLSGRLTLRLGARELRLGPGEAAEFPGTQPHALGPAGPGGVELLALLSAQGELVHTSRAIGLRNSTRNSPEARTPL